MGWEEMPECVNGGKLTGDLAARNISLTPVDEALAKHAFDLETQRVHKFTVVRLELDGQKGKGTRLEVRFKVDFSDLIGCRKLEEYLMVAHKSSVKIEYAPAAVQEEMPLGEEMPPIPADVGCIQCNNGIGFEPNGRTHLTGQVCALQKKKKGPEAVQ
jgi:hypothetical protein